MEYDIFGVSLVWGNNFPKGFGHTSIAYLKKCPDFERAKNGDLTAAFRVVQRCVKPSRIIEMIEKFPDSVLLPVLGRNALPLAFAETIGLPVWKKVIPISTLPRKKMMAIQRLLHKPVFAGSIQEGKEYIIVDDIITQGGTIAALREFVLARGGKVVAVTALAFSIGSHHIAPTINILHYLFFKFGYTIYLLQIIGIFRFFNEMTHSQVKYLLKFSSVYNIFRKIVYADSIRIFKKEKRNKKPFNITKHTREDVAFSNDLTYFPQFEKLRNFYETALIVISNEKLYV
jgi:hypothetical protein